MPPPSAEEHDRLQPTVLESIPLLGLLGIILKDHAPPTTLVVCSSRAAFLEQLTHAVAADVESLTPSDEPTIDAPEDRPSKHSHKLLTPTLDLLSSSRTVRLAFCADLPHLQAYLATYTTKSNAVDESMHAQEGAATLALLNAIELHRETTAFSAQGLGRTLASAVEAAHRNGQRLVVAECLGSNALDEQPELDGPERMEVDILEGLNDEAMAPFEAARQAAELERSVQSIWDESVPILNVTRKSFGSADRPWSGKSVQIRAVAARWCRFMGVEPPHLPPKADTPKANDA